MRPSCPTRALGFALVLVATSIAWAAPPPSTSASSLDLGTHQAGVSFGNSPVWTGLRFNWADRAVRSMKGLNLTLWCVGDLADNWDSVYSGVSLGVVGPAGGSFRGVTIGLAPMAMRELTGLNIGVGYMFSPRVQGLNLAGLFEVDQDLRGITLTGLAALHQGTVRGASVAGLWVDAKDRSEGLVLAGLVVSSSGEMDGAALTLGHVVAPRVRGIAAAGWVRTQALDGLTVGVFNEVRGVQRGLAVGLVNSADELEGVQLGLLNHAGNNPTGLRWMPVLNAHFG